MFNRFFAKMQKPFDVRVISGVLSWPMMRAAPCLGGAGGDAKLLGERHHPELCTHVPTPWVLGKPARPVQCSHLDFLAWKVHCGVRQGAGIQEAGGLEVVHGPSLYILFF